MSATIKAKHTLSSSGGSLGRSSKVVRAKDDTLDDISSQDHDTPYGSRRRRTRVPVRSGSPKPVPELPSRASISKSLSHGTSLGKTTRPTILPIKTSTTPTPSPSPRASSPVRPATAQGSLCTKSPTRQPWGAPAIRTPLQSQSILKKKKSIEVLQATIKVKTPTKPPFIRYSVEELLNLCPFSRVAAGTTFRGRNNPNIAWPLSTANNNEPVPPFSQHSNVYGQHFPSGPADKLFGCSPIIPTQVIGRWPYLLPPLPQLHLDFGNDAWSQILPQNNHFPQHALQTPIRDTRQFHSENRANDVDDLETKIRSALSNRGRRRSMGYPSRNQRSVHWGPAIMAEEASKASENITFDAKSVREEVKQNEVVTDPAPTNDNTILVKEDKRKAKGQKKEFYAYLKNISELKKGDRKKLSQLLEAMSNLDSEDSDSDADQKSSKPDTACVENETAVKRLNPTAATFSTLVQPLQKQLDSRSRVLAENRPTEKTQQLLAKVQPIPEPIWVKTNDLVSATKGQSLTNVNNENIPQSASHSKRLDIRVGRTIVDNTHTSLSVPQPKYARLIEQIGLPSISCPPLLFPSSSVAPLPFTALPLPPPPPLSVERVIKHVVSLDENEHEYIPTEGDYGRVAGAHPWHELTLKRFQRKYPLTGTKCNEPLPALKTTHAAHIQQRLEYLLMEQKEKLAQGASLMDFGMNLSEYEMHRLQQNKQVLKKLKSEFRKEDMIRNARETPKLKSDLNIVTIDLAPPLSEHVPKTSVEESELFNCLLTPSISTGAENDLETTL